MNVDSGNKTVIITGAGHFPGIGADTAHYLLQRSFTVILNSRSWDKQWLDLTHDHPNLELITGDIRHKQIQTTIIHRALDKTSRIDALINNASTGVAQHDANGFLTNACWIENFELNVVVPYDLCMLARPYLAVTQGTVINISSRASLDIGAGNNLAYAASKAAMNRMTQGLTDLLGPEIKVHVLCPGLVASQRLRRIFGDEFDNKVAQYQHMSADGKCVQVEMIAGTILDLINASGHTDTIVPIFSMVDQ